MHLHAKFVDASLAPISRHDNIVFVNRILTIAFPFSFYVGIHNYIQKHKGGFLMLENINLQQIGFILGSSLTTVIAGGIFAAAKSKQDNSVNNITKARGEWRADIKKAIVELNEAWLEEGFGRRAKHTLVHIENHLNPYGEERAEARSYKRKRLSEDDELYFFEDGHIWKNVRIFSAEPSDSSLAELNRSLRLLLKYDWERSKAEIKPRLTWLLAVASALVGAISLSVISPDTIGGNAMVYIMCLAYIPLAEHWSRKPKWRHLKTALLIAIALFMTFALCALLQRAPSNTYDSLFHISACFGYAAPIILSGSALDGGTWGRNARYLRALARADQAQKARADDDVKMI